MPLPTLYCNDIVEGKWNKNRYKIVKKLGEGGVGVVYKAINLLDNKNYALKFSEDNVSINREYNILKELEEVDSVVKVYEIDDTNIRASIYYFIAMECIEGKTLNEYRKTNSIKTKDALYIIIILLNFMGEIHKRGYILGDTKLHNIMISSHGSRVRFIDLGGVVKLGGTLKEFTFAYDRASWGKGSRISEPSYDLFSATIILVNLLLHANINPKKHTLNSIKISLNKKGFKDDLKTIIVQILNGEKKDIKNFANTLIRIYNKECIEEKNVFKKNINYKINLYFVGSLSLFIFTMWLIFIKK